MTDQWSLLINDCKHRYQLTHGTMRHYCFCPQGYTDRPVRLCDPDNCPRLLPDESKTALKDVNDIPDKHPNGCKYFLLPTLNISNRGSEKLKLCWQKRIWIFYYGWDDSFGTKIINNESSIAISVNGYWIGVEKCKKK